MTILHWSVVVLALFLAVTWTLGQRAQRFRPEVINVTVAFWWAGIALTLIGYLNSLDLVFWYVISLLVPPRALLMFRNADVIFPGYLAIGLVTALPIGACLLSEAFFHGFAS